MLFKNDIFHLDGIRYRLLEYVGPRQAWVIAVDDDTAWPRPFGPDELDRAKAEEPETPVSRVPSPAAVAKRDAAFARIAPLVRQTPTIFRRDSRNSLVLARAAEVGATDRTIQKDLRRYWQGGQTPDALLARYHNSGRTDDGETGGRGRPSASGRAVYQMTASDIELIEKHLRDHYLKDARVTLATSHAELRRRHYRYTDGNGKLCTPSEGSYPSMRQFTRVLETKFSLEARIRGRQGDKDFERDHRAVLGSALADCQGVGHYYEIDATIADVYVVSSRDVNKIVGKPTLYLIVDRKSRLIVGFYVGLENASWTGAMEAIASIAADKANLCAFYGVEYDPEDWPAHAVFPREFLADRGPEFVSGASNQICKSLALTVTNLPSLRPDLKPFVECGFKLLHASVADVAPAYDPPWNAMKRRGKRYDKDACLTLKEFGNIILNAIIAQNRKVMRGYELSLREINDGVEPSPIALWNHNLRDSAGLLTRYSESHVRTALMPRDTAAVTEEGIEFRGCYYTCPEAVSRGWFVEARKKRFKITVSFDSRTVDTILVHPRSGKGEPYTAILSPRSNRYRGLSFAEVRYYEAILAAARPGLDHARDQTIDDFRDRTAPVVANARARQKAAKRVSRSARRADTREERLKELQNERAERQALRNPEPAQVTSADVVQLNPTARRHSALTAAAAPHSKPTENDAAQQPVATTTEAPATPKTAQQVLLESRRRLLNG